MISFSNFPKLVKFTDINDPKTVKRVDPYKLTESFGEDVRMVEETIEITDEPVTAGIGKRLWWLPEYYNKRLDGDRFGSAYVENKIANSLSSDDFSMECSHVK